MPYIPFQKQSESGYVPYKARQIVDPPLATKPIAEAKPSGFFSGLLKTAGSFLGNKAKEIVSVPERAIAGEYKGKYKSYLDFVKDVGAKGAEVGKTALVDFAPEIIRSPLRFATEATLSTVGKLAGAEKGITQEKTPLSEIVGEEAAPYVSQLYGRDYIEPFKPKEESIREEFVKPLGGTEKQQKYLPYSFIAVGGLLDFLGGGEGKVVYKELAQEVSEDVIKTILKKEIKGLADDVATTMAKDLKGITEPQAVENYLKSKTKELAEASAGIKPVEEPLLSEAKKYKTPEEFVKAQGIPTFSGAGQITKEWSNEKLGGFGTIYRGRNELGGGIYITDSPEYAKTFGSQLTESSLNKNLKLLDIRESSKAIGDIELNKIKKGFDSYEYYLKNGGEELLPIDYPDEILNKIQSVYGGDSTDILKRAGYDGIIGDESRISGQGGTVWNIFDAKNIKTKSQLTDIWNKANKGLEIKPKLPVLPKIPKVRMEDLDELAAKIKKTDLTLAEKKEIQTSVQALEDTIDNDPAKQLAKYMSRKTGELPEVTGKKTSKFISKGLETGPEKFARAGDQIAQDLGFQSSEEARRAFDSYLVRKNKLNELRASASYLRKEVSAIRKGERLMQLARGDRRAAYRGLKEQYNLSDNEIATVRNGRDIMAMSEGEFERFMKNAETLAAKLEAKRQAQNELQFTIQDRGFVNVDNLRKAMKLPEIRNMTPDQIKEFDTLLRSFKTGDEFLPVRMLETIDRTAIAGVKTTREVLEALSKKSGRAVENMPIKIIEWHRTLGDRRLAKEHPFLEFMVQRKNESLLKAEARVIELSNKLNDLLVKARASRKRGLLDRLVPSDKKITEWSETLDPVKRSALEETMTKEEIAVVREWDKIRREYYSYLVQKNLGRKFSRFEGQYFPHVRRGFLEAWKEDGILKAFKEMRNKYKQDQFMMDILNERTGEILPYEKWIGFSQFRTDKLVPSSNAGRAFEAYITALEKAKHLDEMIPEMMAYVHTLSPRGLSRFGVELDTSLKKFFKEYINANKGRVPKGFFNPGEGFDVFNRSMIALTRMLDLGFNITTQAVAPIGENLFTLSMLKPKAYALAYKRLASAEGREILKKYENFVGRTLWDELSRASGNIGDKLLKGAFAIYHGATRQANSLFLLGNMTEEEFKLGKVSAERLAKLRVEMSKYRSVRGLESILGRTTEAEAVKQYKSWAIPPLTATIENSLELAKMVRKDGLRALASDRGKELFYSLGTGLALAVLFYDGYKSLEKNKDRTPAEDLAFKAMRDALSIYGAFDPTLWSKVRVADFFEDIGQATMDLIELEKYENGELKGVKEFSRALTPSILRRLDIGAQEEKKSGGGSSVKLPDLPKLPKLPKLPAPPTLPKL